MKALLSIEIEGNTVTLENGTTVSLSYLDGCEIFSAGGAAEAAEADSGLTLQSLDTGVEAIVASGQYEGFRVMRAGDVALYKSSGDANFQQVPSHIDFSAISVREA